MDLETKENEKENNNNYKYWKEFREGLYKLIKDDENGVKIEKTPENIYAMAKKRGVKPTARYFSMDPSNVRRYIKKFEE